MRTLIISACLVVVGCTALAQAPDARTAPPVVVRKTVQTTDGKTLEGRVLNAIENGVDSSTTPGRMPGGILNEEQAKEVAAFVAATAGES